MENKDLRGKEKEHLEPIYVDSDESSDQEQKSPLNQTNQPDSLNSELGLDSLEFLDFELPENLIKEIDSISQAPTLENPDNIDQKASEAPQQPIQETTLQSTEQTKPKSFNYFTTIEEKVNKFESDLRTKVNGFSDKKRKALGYSMITLASMLGTILILGFITTVNFTGFFAEAKQLKDQVVEVAGTVNFDDKPKDTNIPVIANLSDPNSINWQPTHSLLASTPKRRKMVAKSLGIDKGEWILACFSVDCGDCDRVAQTLNQLSNLKNIVAITKASATDATLWKERLGLKFEVKAVSEQTLEDTGTVLLPTIIKLKNGEFIGAVESLEEK